MEANHQFIEAARQTARYAGRRRIASTMLDEGLVSPRPRNGDDLGGPFAFAVAGALLFTLFQPDWMSVGVLCLVGAGWAAYYYWRGGRIRGVRDVEARMSAPIYAIAPRVPQRALRMLPPDRRTPADFVLERPDFDYATAFRRIGRRSATDGLSDPPVIAFSAARARDGGAAEALALARTLASQGKKIVAIDCDLRLKRMTQMAGAGAESGVWEVLTGDVGWRAALAPDPSSQAQLLSACGGGDDPRALFEQPVFQRMLHELRQEFDYVILSCPAALELAVAPVLMNHATTVVLVVRQGRSTIGDVRAALRLLWRFRVGPATGILLTEAQIGDPLAEVARKWRRRGYRYAVAD